MSFLEVLALSLIPTFEGRYAVIYGLGRGYPVSETILASIAGVLLLSFALPALLPGIDRVMIALENTFLSRIAKLYMYYIERVRNKARPYVERWGLIGLTIFVAIPLPGTGVWTGALAAYILGMEKKITIPALILGGTISIAITALPTLGLLKM
ncbi:ligand-binding protein SH3 [Thermococcus chitonophagus]|uniref:Ligand-binding protein SH3 n=1 Tax=Thermococcus chitonophagus TaxID=54262 RepID=A0A160VU12_9EURY|nr:COG2426 family protein [Thermococcus chitonophagus]ASJ16341.1 ligand-binding protein SH3 [Thermococcus chitonophagus]CUX78667.1 putative small multidrug export protein [Thermococcus chitonophagus]